MPEIDIRFGLWNANGLCQHRNEVETFIKNNQLDMLLVSETHFSERSYFNIQGFNLIKTNRPDGMARGGSAILIKSNIIYEELLQYQTIGIQATMIKIKCGAKPIVFSAIYCRPRDQLKLADYMELFNQMGGAFIAGGDYNAKHTWWGSRINTTKGRELYKCLRDMNYMAISTGSPTYWPTRANTIPDLLDFFVCSQINAEQLTVEPSWELSSDHSPIIAILNLRAAVVPRNPRIDYYKFKTETQKLLQPNLSLKNKGELEDATEHLTNSIKTAKNNSVVPFNECPSHVSLIIRNMINDKRKLRRKYHRTLYAPDKTKYNKACKDLKKYLAEYNQNKVNDFLTQLGPSEKGDKNLFNATRSVQRPITRFPPIQDRNGLWLRSAKEKADAFAGHLEEQFTPFPSLHDDSEISMCVNAPTQLDLPLISFRTKEIKEEIHLLNPKKAPGCDEITPRILKALPESAFLLITQIFNGILRLGEYPRQWKKSQIVMIYKPGKPENELSSYRPISLLPVLSKVFERLFKARILCFVKLPTHQFGFTTGHGTTEQCHRVVHYIQSALQEGEYCAAVYLDIKQAFDRVWHTGLLYKLRAILPSNAFLVIKSYLQERTFKVCYGNEESGWKGIEAGVPQGSVLGPLLYTVFTADMDIVESAFTGTFADDTAFLSRDDTQAKAINTVQGQLQKFENWANKWRLRVSAEKSQYVMYTLKNELEIASPTMYGESIPEASVAKYLGLYIDKKLLFDVHLNKKKEQLKLLRNKFYWLTGRESSLNLQNKVLIYKTIFRPMWAYCAVLWGAARTTHINKIQVAQSTYLRAAVNAPWFVTNFSIHRDLRVEPVTDYINQLIEAHKNRMQMHRNILIQDLIGQNINRRLSRRVILDRIN